MLCTNDTDECPTELLPPEVNNIRTLDDQEERHLPAENGYSHVIGQLSSGRERASGGELASKSNWQMLDLPSASSFRFAPLTITSMITHLFILFRAERYAAESLYDR